MSLVVILIPSTQQGHCDYPLTDLGLSQAETIGENLNFVPWQQIYSSDLPRAHNTAKLLLSKSTKPNQNIVLSDSIREIAYGVREGLSRKLTVAEAREEYARKNNLKVEDVVDTAEPTERVKNRQKDFVSQVLQDYLKENPADNHSFNDGNPSNDSIFKPRNVPILCVSHGGYIKLFLRTYCEFPIEKSLGNCSVSIVTIEWDDIGEPTKFKCTTSADRVNMSPQDS